MLDELTINRNGSPTTTYQKPTVVRHNVGVMNHFGRSHSMRPQTEFEGVEIRSLLDEFGSPLWLLSEKTLRRQYRQMYKAFSLRYPRVIIAYSYKTNYLSSVCSVLHQEGAWAEVVSGFEYETARHLNMPGRQIVFNGPLKSRAELMRAVEEEAMINADSFEELQMLAEIARELKREVPVGIRVNVRLNYPPWDRFGFSLEAGQALEAARRVVSSENLRLRRLHCHVGTFITDPNTYTSMLEKVVAFGVRLSRDFMVRLEYLDIGGGYASRNNLRGSWLPPEYACPTPDQYAEAVCPIPLQADFPHDQLPMLILEPGRSLVDEAMHLGSKVVSNRRLSNGERGLVLDAGVNLLYTATWYDHDIVPAQDTGGLLEEAHVFGALCMQIDILRRSVPLPPMRRGDAVLIRNVGAYNFSQSMQFIHLRPAVVLLNDGQIEIVRERENGDYVRQLEHVPDRLRRKG